MHDQVARSFIESFFTSLVSADEQVADFFGADASLVMSTDSLCGENITSRGPEVRPAITKLSNELQNGKIHVIDFVSQESGPVINVTVFGVVAFPEGSKRFHLSAVLAKVSDDHYFVQALSFVAFTEEAKVEQPTNAEPEPPVVEEQPAQVPVQEEAPAEEPVPVKKSKKKGSKKEKVTEAAEPKQEEPVPEEPIKEEEVAEKAPEVEQPAAVETGAPKSWAKLASAKPKPGSSKPTQVVRVSPTPAQEQEETVPAPVEAAKEKKPREPPACGLLFTVEHGVSDDEIRNGLGSLKNHIVSLRNRSETKKLVFVDFDISSAFETLRKESPLIGGKKILVSRQKSHA